MFCRYCGRQIPDGEVCPCQKKQNAGTQENPKMRPATKKPEMRGQRPPEQKQPRQAVPKQAPPKQKPPKQKPVKQKPPIQPSMMPDGRLLAVLAFVLAVAAVALFVVLRFVLSDSVSSDSVIGMIYPYLIYIVPITLGVIGCLFGVFSLQDKRIRTLSIAGIAVCALLSAGMLGSMFVFPYEPDSSYISDDDDEEDEDDDEDGKSKDDDDDERDDGKSKDDEDEKDSVVGKIKESYEDGKLDYAGVKELNDLDTDDLSDEEAEDLMTLQEDIEADLVTDIEDLVKASDYEGAFEKLNKIVEELEEDDLAESLLDKYEAEYIMYLVEESEKLAGEGKKEDAVKMLTTAKDLVNDTEAVEDILKDVESGTLGGDYIIADSNSRLLTDADVKDLTLQEINYAKNEIYARHGRQFASKELQDYFNSKSWYNGTVPAGSFSESVFNTYEKKNAEFLSKVEFSIDSAGYKLDVN